jgi:hypothetical protein
LEIFFLHNFRAPFPPFFPLKLGSFLLGLIALESEKFQAVWGDVRLTLVVVELKFPSGPGRGFD